MSPGADRAITVAPPTISVSNGRSVKGSDCSVIPADVFTDAEDGWTSVGRAHLILDSLIDSGKAVPMIVVMPLGYGNFNFLLGGFANWDIPSTVDENTTLFGQMLETEVMPAVERESRRDPLGAL